MVGLGARSRRGGAVVPADTLLGANLETAQVLVPPQDRDTVLIFYEAGDNEEATPYRYKFSTGTLAQVAASEFEEVTDFEGNLENRPGATFHEQRLIVGGGPRRAGTMHPDQWASVTGSRSPDPETGATRYFNLVPYNVVGQANQNVPDGAFNFTVASDEAIEIQWLTTFYDWLVVGADRGIWFMRYLQPDQRPQIRRQSRVGANGVRPVTTSHGFAYVGADGREVYIAPGRQIDREAWGPPGELTLYAAHITESGVREMAWQQHPEERLWVLMNNGTLACCHFHGGLIGWTRMPTGCEITSIAMQPGYRSEPDVLWALLREYPGAPHSLARMTAANHVDCRATATVRSARVGRPPHVEVRAAEGMMVRLIDTSSTPHRYTDRPAEVDDEGTYCAAPFTVGTEIVVGQSVKARIHLPQVASLQGPAWGQPKRAARATVGMVDSTGGQLGIREDRLRAITADEPGMERDQQETVNVPDADLFDTTQSLWVVHDSPGGFELTYLAVETEGG